MYLQISLHHHPFPASFVIIIENTNAHYKQAQITFGIFLLLCVANALDCLIFII